MGGIANPLELQHWNQLWEATGGRQTGLFDMLNVKYVLARDGTPLPLQKFELAFDAPGDLSVYRNTEFKPRAWLVHDVVHMPDLEAAIDAIQDPDFDPDHTVVLSNGAQETERLADAIAPDAVGVVDMGRYGGNHMSFDVNTANPAYLVVSEVWYPGWQATVNEKETEVEPANGGLRAVAVPAGRSTVELRFHATYLDLGVDGGRSWSAVVGRCAGVCLVCRAPGVGRGAGGQMNAHTERCGRC